MQKPRSPADARTRMSDRACACTVRVFMSSRACDGERKKSTVLQPPPMFVKPLHPDHWCFWSLDLGASIPHYLGTLLTTSTHSLHLVIGYTASYADARFGCTYRAYTYMKRYNSREGRRKKTSHNSSLFLFQPYLPKPSGIPGAQTLHTAAARWLLSVPPYISPPSYHAWY